MAFRNLKTKLVTKEMPYIVVINSVHVSVLRYIGSTAWGHRSNGDVTGTSIFGILPTFRGRLIDWEQRSQTGRKPVLIWS
jgi:hypothetical protein